jgi:hypothetical protein
MMARDKVALYFVTGLNTVHLSNYSLERSLTVDSLGMPGKSTPSKCSKTPLFTADSTLMDMCGNGSV